MTASGFGLRGSGLGDRGDPKHVRSSAPASWGEAFGFSVLDFGSWGDSMHVQSTSRKYEGEKNGDRGHLARMKLPSRALNTARTKGSRGKVKAERDQSFERRAVREGEGWRGGNGRPYTPQPPNISGRRPVAHTAILSKEGWRWGEGRHLACLKPPHRCEVHRCVQTQIGRNGGRHESAT